MKYEINRRKIVLFFIMILSALLIVSCSYSRYPQEVQQALDKAGANRAELIKVLEHYNSPQDSLKLKAAFYLIANMPGHEYTVFALYDAAGKEVDFNVLDYPDYKTMVAAWDSIAAKRGELDFKRKESIKDIEQISADLLINNIDLAFKVWMGKSWARPLKFDTFRRFVLPYRGSGEPLENWRSYFMEKYAYIDSVLAGSRDVVKAARIINTDLKSWFKFDSRFYRHPTDQGLSEMLKTKMGRCEDMANLAIFAMRANGLAVTSDYTPYWADAANNHAWNALLDSSGKAVPFMGSLFNPGEYTLPNRIAKVYRKTYEYQKANLIFKVGAKTAVPRWLGGKSYSDVTADYVPVSDVRLKLERPHADSVRYAYLCVFNTGEWQAIQWGEITDDSVTFKDMGRDLAYLPAYYVNKKLIPAAAPFILTKDGAVKILNSDSTQKITVALRSTTKRTTTQATDSNRKSFLTSGAEYELFYWADGWISFGSAKTRGRAALIFKKVPNKALLWLVQKGSKKYERIFIYEDNRQIWY